MLEWSKREAVPSLELEESDGFPCPSSRSSQILRLFPHWGCPTSPGKGISKLGHQKADAQCEHFLLVSWFSNEYLLTGCRFGAVEPGLLIFTSPRTNMARKAGRRWSHRGCLTSHAHPTNTNTSSCEVSVNSLRGIRTRTPAQLLNTPPSLCDTAAKVCSLKNKGIWGRSFYFKVPAQPHGLSS